MTRITRIEVIDENGRSYVNWEEDNDITLSYQDDGRTLKVFVNTMKPKSPAEEAYKRVYGAYPMGEPFWIVFKKGYDAAFFEGCKVEEEPKPKIEFLCNVMRNLGYPIEYCDEIVDAVEKWLPDELSCDNGVHNGVYELGWNDAIETIKDKLK